MTKNPGRPVAAITELGLRRLKDDTQMSDDTRLSLEVMARCPEGITDIELDAIIDEAIKIHGSAAAAIEALTLGYVKIATPEEK